MAFVRSFLHIIPPLTDDPYQDLVQADALFIINWSLLTEPDIHLLNQINIAIFDAKNVLDDEQIALLTAPYYGIWREKHP